MTAQEYLLNYSGLTVERNDEYEYYGYKVFNEGFFEVNVFYKLFMQHITVCVKTCSPGSKPHLHANVSCLCGIRTAEDVKFILSKICLLGHNDFAFPELAKEVSTLMEKSL